jgi:hypothetical protein
MTLAKIFIAQGFEKIPLVRVFRIFSPAHLISPRRVASPLQRFFQSADCRAVDPKTEAASTGHS